MTSVNRRRARSRAQAGARVAAPGLRHRTGAWALRRIGGALVTVMLVALLGGGLLAMWLSAGPVSLGGLARQVAAEMSARTPGRTIEIEDMALDVSRAGLPAGLRLIGLAIRGDDGAIIARAPEVSVRFHILDALRGVAAPTRVVVSGLSMTVTREADGRVHGGFELTGDEGADPEIPGGDAAALGLVGVLSEIDAMTGPLQRLKTVEGRDLRLTFVDVASGARWSADDVRLRIARTGDALTAEVMAGAPAHPWLRLAARRGTGDETGDETGGETGGGTGAGTGGAAGPARTSVLLTLSGATGPSLAAAFPPLAALGRVDAPLTGRIAGVVLDDGATRGLTAWLSVGAGRLIGVDGVAGRIDGGRVDLSMAPDRERLTLESAVIEGGLGSARLSGAATLRRGPQGLPEGAELTLEIAELALTPEAGFDTAMAFGPGRIAGDLSFDHLALRLREAAIEAPGLSLSATGGGALVDGGWTGALSARATAPIVAASLAPNWPRGLAPGAREWVEENLIGGVVDALDISVALSPGEASADIAFTFRDVSATAVRGLPPIEAGMGRGRVSIPKSGPGTFEVIAEAGHVTPPGGDAIDIGGSRFFIADVEAKTPLGLAEVTATGAIADMLLMIDQPPLLLTRKLGADLGPIAGTATARVKIDLPLLKDLLLDDVDVSVEGDLRDVALSLPGIGLPARAKTAKVAADIRHLILSADAVVDGTPVDVTWEEVFSPPPGAAPTRIDVTAAVNAALLARAGVDALTIEDGAGRARARIEIPRGARASLGVEATLDGAALSIPALGWSKPRGEAATLSLGGTIGVTAGTDALILSRLSVDAPGLVAAGAAQGVSLRLDAAGTLSAARLGRITVDGALEGALDYGLSGGVAKLRFDGPYLNVGRLASLGREDDAAPLGPPLALSVTAGRLALTDAITLHDARLEAARDAVGAMRASLSGAAGGGAPVRIELERAGPAAMARAVLTAEDAGAALRDLGLFDGARGGTLTVRAALGGDDAVTGDAVAEGMTLDADTALVRGLAAASLFGVVERAGTGGLTFARIEAPFSLRGDLLHIEDALARGASLGLTLSGDWHRKADRLDLRGVITPAYAINGLLNRVPLLGALLGGEGEGLIGVTFRVTGSSEDPSISANPLSALTPGVLRGVFGGASKETIAPPGERPAATPAPDAGAVDAGAVDAGAADAGAPAAGAADAGNTDAGGREAEGVAIPQSPDNARVDR
jgi:hypothetical protein